MPGCKPWNFCRRQTGSSAGLRRQTAVRNNQHMSGWEVSVSWRYRVVRRLYQKLSKRESPPAVVSLALARSFFLAPGCDLWPPAEFLEQRIGFAFNRIGDDVP